MTMAGGELGEEGQAPEVNTAQSRPYSARSAKVRSSGNEHALLLSLSSPIGQARSPGGTQPRSACVSHRSSSSQGRQ